MITKVCAKCGVTKPLSEFDKEPNCTTDGHRKTCKACRSVYTRIAAVKHARKKQTEYREKERVFRIEHPDLFAADVKKRKIWNDYTVRLYKWEHQDEHREYLHNKQLVNKLLVLSHYGLGGCATCVKCGESRLDCLSIDHVNGDGYKEKKHQRGGKGLYSRIIEADFPDGFQTLCMNCQWIKRHRNGEWGNVRVRKNSISQPVHPEGDPPKNWTPYSGRLDGAVFDSRYSPQGKHYQRQRKKEQ